MKAILAPDHLYSRSEVCSRPCPVPARPGVYAFYFDKPPPGINSKECHRVGQHLLLYIGISPKAPPLNGRAPSKSHLRRRLQTHYGGNAEGSTLRLTLGCLLSAQLGIHLRRVGSGDRYTFTNPGEQALDKWMDQHAFVTWVQTNAPWKPEKSLLSSGLRLPLNVDGSPWQEAATIVRAARLKARRHADQLDIIADSGGPRRERMTVIRTRHSPKKNRDKFIGAIVDCIKHADDARQKRVRVAMQNYIDNTRVALSQKHPFVHQLLMNLQSAAKRKQRGSR